jgi:hypothetical protein
VGVEERCAAGAAHQPVARIRPGGRAALHHAGGDAVLFEQLSAVVRDEHLELVPVVIGAAGLHAGA